MKRRGQPPSDIHVRLPSDLHDDLGAAARESMRSLNGEIVYALRLHLLQRKKRLESEKTA